MAGDELFKRYLEMGASVLGMSRERAESIVKDLVASGEVARGQATKAADWLVERGRSGTEELAELVRREVRQQVAALGLATKDDIARLEAQLAGTRASAANAATPTTAAAAVSRPAAAPAAKTTSAPATGGAVGKRPAAKKAGATRPVADASGGAGDVTAPGPVRSRGRGRAAGGSAAPGAGGGGAGITRSGSVRRRSSGSGPMKPDPAPPAGGAVPPKG